MRILHMISGGDVGGAKTHVLSLLRALRREHEVVLVCFVKGAFSREAEEMGIPTQVLEGMGFLGTERRLRSLIRQGQFDLIHCHGSRANLMGWLLKRSVKIPIVTTIHSDPELDYLGRPLSNLTYGTANRLALRRLDAWICVSGELQKKLTQKGFDPYEMYTIPNGVDFSTPYEGPNREEYWRQHGVEVPAGGVVFGIAARISPVKDMGTLIRAFAQAVREEPNIRLAIAGDGEQKQELEALAAELCPEGTVAFLGWMEDTDGFYHAIDVNMLTSLSEGLPYAIAEGARMSCATIATAVGAVPQIVIDGKTGFLVKPGDADGIGRKMLEVARDPALRKRLGQEIYGRVRTSFSLETTVKTQVEIYEKILHRRSRASQERDGILICGAYGKGNMGDETILGAILQRLRSHDPDVPIYVLSRRPRQTSADNLVRGIFTFDVIRTYKAMKRCRLLISGGGSLIQDATSTRSLLFYLHTLKQARKRGCKVMMYGCGIGPVSRKNNRKRAGRIIDRYADLITLRDPESQEELKSLGVTKPEVRVTADPALLQTVPKNKMWEYEAYRKAAGLERNGRYCLLALRPWGNVHKKAAVIGRIAEYVYHHYGLTPVLFLLEPEKDRAISQMVYEQIHCPKLLLPELSDGGLICALVRDMELVISMRLHALIFAAGQGTPVVGISYDPKVRGFMDYMGQNDYVSVEEIEEAALMKCVDHALNQGEGTDAALKRLRLLAAQNDALAWELMNQDEVQK